MLYLSKKLSLVDINHTPTELLRLAYLLNFFAADTGVQNYKLGTLALKIVYFGIKEHVYGIPVGKA